MKILIFGRGTIGSFYGWALEKGGHSVEFYVRAGRAAEYGSVLPMEFYDARTQFRGILVKEKWVIRVREDLPVDHDYDLILISVHHYSFDDVAAFLAPRTAKATILIFNNFLIEPQQAASQLPTERLAWGFPGAGGGIDKSGTLRGALYSLVQFGTFGTDPTERELAVRDLFRKSGFKVQEQRDFRGWLWIHFAASAGLIAQALTAKGSLKRVMESMTLSRSAILNVREMLSVVRARGVNLKIHHIEVIVFLLPTWVGGLALKMAIKFNAPLRAGVEYGANPKEMKSICRDVLEAAELLGVSVPRLKSVETLFPELVA